MPQIRCPECGTLINLEKRKETDVKLILGMLRRKPKTFTEILRATRLPRKTLCLRLKELLNSGMISKDGDYCLTARGRRSLSESKERIIWSGLDLKNSRFLRETLEGGSSAVILASLFSLLTISFFTMPAISSAPPTFTVDIYIRDAVDVFGWEVYVVFDTNALYVKEIAPGDFLSDDTLVINSTASDHSYTKQFQGDSMLCFNSRSAHGEVHLAETRLGAIGGVSGYGRLVTITFGIRKDTGNFNPYIGYSLLLGPDLCQTEGVLALV